ncbi:MAG: hypothetical protein PUC50_03035 [Bacteroidales bacterium]|nr:hypothetical protein [Bacteroidales bacterium]
MSTMELRAELFQNINPLLDDESLLREVLDFIKGLVSRKKEAASTVSVQHDSDEEIEAGLRQAFKELKSVKEGKLQTRDFFEVVNEL